LTLNTRTTPGSLGIQEPSQHAPTHTDQTKDTRTHARTHAHGQIMRMPSFISAFIQNVASAASVREPTHAWCVRECLHLRLRLYVYVCAESALSSHVLDAPGHHVCVLMRMYFHCCLGHVLACVCMCVHVYMRYPSE
jgi:hypothetical protein